MSDTEVAELVVREQGARLLGWQRNDYVCAGCVEAGKTLDDSTHLDWPAYVDAEGRAYCGRDYAAHTEHIRVGTAEAFDGGLDIVAPLPHERLNR